MKKFIFFFFAFLTLTLLSGCNREPNTVRFNPDEDTRSTSEISENTKDETVKEEANSETETAVTEEVKKNATAIKLAITSFIGETLKTTKNSNEISGVTPLETEKLTVNGQEVDEFTSGSKGWTYIASVKKGNLKEGKNSYSMIAEDKSGKKLDSLTFTISYQSPESTDQLPSTGNSSLFILLIGSMALSGIYVFRKKILQNRI